MASDRGWTGTGISGTKKAATFRFRFLLQPLYYKAPTLIITGMIKYWYQWPDPHIAPESPAVATIYVM